MQHTWQERGSGGDRERGQTINYPWYLGRVTTYDPINKSDSVASATSGLRSRQPRVEPSTWVDAGPGMYHQMPEYTVTAWTLLAAALPPSPVCQ